MTYKQISHLVEYQRERCKSYEDEEILKILQRTQSKLKERSVNIPFTEFWDLYDKKVERPKCERKWKRLTDQERTSIMTHIPKYKIAQPDKMYRKNPSTYLYNRCWEDEIIEVRKEEEQLIRRVAWL